MYVVYVVYCICYFVFWSFFLAAYVNLDNGDVLMLIVRPLVPSLVTDILPHLTVNNTTSLTPVHLFCLRIALETRNGRWVFWIFGSGLRSQKVVHLLWYFWSFKLLNLSTQVVGTTSNTGSIQFLTQIDITIDSTSIAIHKGNLDVLGAGSS